MGSLLSVHGLHAQCAWAHCTVCMGSMLSVHGLHAQCTWAHCTVHVTSLAVCCSLLSACNHKVWLPLTAETAECRPCHIPSLILVQACEGSPGNPRRPMPRPLPLQCWAQISSMTASVGQKSHPTLEVLGTNPTQSCKRWARSPLQVLDAHPNQDCKCWT
eukprot:11933-Chlamydomonas_euryale.AAC.1